MHNCVWRRLNRTLTTQTTRPCIGPPPSMQSLQKGFVSVLKTTRSVILPSDALEQRVEANMRGAALEFVLQLMSSYRSVCATKQNRCGALLHPTTLSASAIHSLMEHKPSQKMRTFRGANLCRPAICSHTSSPPQKTDPQRDNDESKQKNNLHVGTVEWGCASLRWENIKQYRNNRK